VEVSFYSHEGAGTLIAALVLCFTCFSYTICGI